jgi:hypothetical protein
MTHKTNEQISIRLSKHWVTYTFFNRKKTVLNLCLMKQLHFAILFAVAAEQRNFSRGKLRKPFGDFVRRQALLKNAFHMSGKQYSDEMLL